MVYTSKLHQGIYKPQNPKKYRGNVHNITYRSGWELSFMRWADTNASVVEWSSEEIVIPYRTVLDEAADRKNGKKTPTWHRYYVDFFVKIKTKGGLFERILVEVKPYHETIPPVITEGTSKKSALYKQKTWIVNQAKWRAASEWAHDRGMKFKVITEKNIFGQR